MRVLFLLPAFLFAALPAAACNMDVRHRGVTVADYVETVQPCLRAWPAGYTADAAMETDFFIRVNAERTSRGLKPLRYRPELLDAARFQSLDMAYNNFFGHEGPDGRHHFDRVAAFDRSALVQYSAENVAMVGSHGRTVESEAQRRRAPARQSDGQPRPPQKYSQPGYYRRCDGRCADGVRRLGDTGLP